MSGVKPGWARAVTCRVLYLFDQANSTASQKGEPVVTHCPGSRSSGDCRVSDEVIDDSTLRRRFSRAEFPGAQRRVTPTHGSGDRGTLTGQTITAVMPSARSLSRSVGHDAARCELRLREQQRCRQSAGCRLLLQQPCYAKQNENETWELLQPTSSLADAAESRTDVPEPRSIAALGVPSCRRRR